MSYNPFSRREEHSRNAIITYKVGTAVSWLLLVVTSIAYTFSSPNEGHKPRRTIWGQNNAHLSPFSMNSVITSIYWILLYLLQLVYTYHLYSSSSVHLTAAANIGSHFILHNLLIFGFIHLWTRSHFWLALLLIVVNFFNLSAAYFRHPTMPRSIHIGTVSGPLAWNFVALYWVGAVAVHAHNLPARIVANIFIWGILVYGGFFLMAYKDYTMGIALSVLAAAIGVSQFLTKVIAFQWIFAFVIMAVLFLFSLLVATGNGPFRGGEVVSQDQERAPLLADE